MIVFDHQDQISNGASMATHFVHMMTPDSICNRIKGRTLTGGEEGVPCSFIHPPRSIWILTD
jgi:hypothetical protein